MDQWRRWIVLVAVLGTACAPAFTPPAGPGEPAPDADAAWAQATASCRGARTYSAMLHFGAVGANVQTTVTDDGRVRLGAVVAGRPRFTLTGSRDDATLLLHDDRRVVRAPAAAIVEQLIGTAIGPEEWLAFVTGCVTRSHQIKDAARVGKYLRITTAEGRVYLQQQGGVWRVHGGEVLGLIVHYEWRDSAFPTVLRARSAPGTSVETRLALEAAQFRVNDTVAPELFTPPKAVAGATSMTLEELREAGPLSRRKE
jgi:hypothetical protein